MKHPPIKTKEFDKFIQLQNQTYKVLIKQICDTLAKWKFGSPTKQVHGEQIHNTLKRESFNHFYFLIFVVEEETYLHIEWCHFAISTLTLYGPSHWIKIFLWNCWYLEINKNISIRKQYNFQTFLIHTFMWLLYIQYALWTITDPSIYLWCCMRFSTCDTYLSNEQ